MNNRIRTLFAESLAKAWAVAVVRVSRMDATQRIADTEAGKDKTDLRAAMHGQRPRTQNGAVLFFTLIALVAMTLAALAMVRSVDTGNLVAGNISLKQGAIQEADKVMNIAFSCLDTGGALTGGDLGNSIATCNYYSFLQPDVSKPFGIPDVLETTSPFATNSATGNTSSYVIERMCTLAGATDIAGQSCVASPFGREASKANKGEKGIPPPQAIYRISVKISGPRNVAAYSQMVMNAGQ